MVSKMPKYKITVLKRTINRDLIEEYIVDLYHDIIYVNVLNLQYL